MFIFRSVNADMIIFRPFDALVASRPCISIIDLNLIFNDEVTRKMWSFKNMKSYTSCSFFQWSSSRLGSGMRGTFFTCFGIFEQFPFLIWQPFVHIWLHTCWFHWQKIWFWQFGFWQGRFGILAQKASHFTLVGQNIYPLLQFHVN